MSLSDIVFNNTIEKIAEYNDDFNYELYPDASNKVIAEDFLVSGECNMFAEILHNLTGLPIKVFLFQNNEGFGHHSVVQLTQDQYMDAKGIFSTKEIVSRYGYLFKETQIVDVVDSIFFGYEENEDLESLISSYIQNHHILHKYVQLDLNNNLQKHKSNNCLNLC